MESAPQTPGRQTRNAVTRRITARVTADWPRLGGPGVRYRNRYCYVAVTLPGHREPTPVLRLRWQGSPGQRAIAICKARAGQYGENELPASFSPVTGTPRTGNRRDARPLRRPASPELTGRAHPGRAAFDPADRFLPVSGQLPSGGTRLSPGEIEALSARWSSCWSPGQVARHLAGTTTPWCVAAGWALDLFRGTQTREHGDTEIAVPAAGFPEIRGRLPGYAFDAVGSGRIWENAAPDVLAATHQTWLRDPATGSYLLDVFREPRDGQTWICRHDETIRLPYGEIIRRTPDGIPYLAPELVLLFKARHARPKDQQDFDETIPHMTPAQRQTLAGLLARAHPGHQWLANLQPARQEPSDGYTQP